MLQRRRILSLSVKFWMPCVLTLLMTGCQYLPHALQPNQLHKLNRGKELGRDTYNFSIKDPAIPPRNLPDEQQSRTEKFH